MQSNHIDEENFINKIIYDYLHVFITLVGIIIIYCN